MCAGTSFVVFGPYGPFCLSKWKQWHDHNQNSLWISHLCYRTRKKAHTHTHTYTNSGRNWCWSNNDWVRIVKEINNKKRTMVRHLFTRYYVVLFTYNYNCGCCNRGYLHPLVRGNSCCFLPLRCCLFLLFSSFESYFRFQRTYPPVRGSVVMFFFPPLRWRSFLFPLFESQFSR